MANSGTEETAAVAAADRISNLLDFAEVALKTDDATRPSVGDDGQVRPGAVAIF